MKEEPPRASPARARGGASPGVRGAWGRERAASRSRHTAQAVRRECGLAKGKRRRKRKRKRRNRKGLKPKLLPRASGLAPTECAHRTAPARGRSWINHTHASRTQTQDKTPLAHRPRRHA